MAKTAEITYQRVSEACRELFATGKNPSVRVVRDRVGGGSHSILAEYIRRWRSEYELSERSSMEVSDELNQALRAEFTRVTQSIKERLELQIAERDNTIEENLGIIRELEEQNASYIDVMSKRQKEQDANILDREKKISVLEEKLKTANLYLKGAKKDRDKYLEWYHEQKTKAAVAETKVEELAKQLKKK